MRKAKSMLEQIQVENRERYDYRHFLQRFSVLREEMQVDPDSFDYIFYTYGLSLYGNMPLVEPLESKEVSRIEDFVVVIDTSMSCSGDLVRCFWRKPTMCFVSRTVILRRPTSTSSSAMNRCSRIVSLQSGGDGSLHA